MTQSLQGNILTPGGWVRGTIAFDQHILRIDGQAGDPASNGDDFILPGFIDLHVHGGGGRDFMQAGDAAQTIARLHASHGTTSLLATTMTAPDSDIDHALRAIAAACVDRRGEAARRAPGRSVHQPGQAWRATRPRACRDAAGADAAGDAGADPAGHDRPRSRRSSGHRQGAQRGWRQGADWSQPGQLRGWRRRA